jgi:hypothetical protein
MVRLQLTLFSKRTRAFLFKTFGGFLHVPTSQIYCLTGAVISETRIMKIYLNTTTRSSKLLPFNPMYHILDFNKIRLTELATYEKWADLAYLVCTLACTLCTLCIKAYPKYMYSELFH